MISKRNGEEVPFFTRYPIFSSEKERNITYDDAEFYISHDIEMIITLRNLRNGTITEETIKQSISCLEEDNREVCIDIRDDNAYVLLSFYDEYERTSTYSWLFKYTIAPGDTHIYLWNEIYETETTKVFIVGDLGTIQEKFYKNAIHELTILFGWLDLEPPTEIGNLSLKRVYETYLKTYHDFEDYSDKNHILYTDYKTLVLKNEHRGGGVILTSMSILDLNVL